MLAAWASVLPEENQQGAYGVGCIAISNRLWQPVFADGEPYSYDFPRRRASGRPRRKHHVQRDVGAGSMVKREQLRDGQTRSVHGSRGTFPEQLIQRLPHLEPDQLPYAGW